MYYARLWMDNLKPTDGQFHPPSVHCFSASFHPWKGRINVNLGEEGTFPDCSNPFEVSSSFLLSHVTVIFASTKCTVVQNMFVHFIHMCIILHIEIVLNYQLVQLTLQEDAQAQRWMKSSALDLEACGRHQTFEKNLPEPQDLPRGWLYVPYNLLRTGGQMGLKRTQALFTYLFPFQPPMDPSNLTWTFVPVSHMTQVRRKLFAHLTSIYWAPSMFQTLF